MLNFCYVMHYSQKVSSYSFILILFAVLSAVLNNFFENTKEVVSFRVSEFTYGDFYKFTPEVYSGFSRINFVGVIRVNQRAPLCLIIC